jgi:hypothetical protein
MLNQTPQKAALIHKVDHESCIDEVDDENCIGEVHNKSCKDTSRTCSCRLRSNNESLAHESNQHGNETRGVGFKFAAVLQDPMKIEREQMLVARFRSFASAYVRYRGPRPSKFDSRKTDLKSSCQQSFHGWSSESKYRGMMGDGLLEMAVAQARLVFI